MESRDIKSGKKNELGKMRRALYTLMSLGCSQDKASLFNYEQNYSILRYSGLVSENDCEAFVSENISNPPTKILSKNLQSFLYGLFNPFLYDNGMSKINVHKYIPNKSVEQLYTDKQLHLNLLLYLKREFEDEAKRTLESCSDSVHPITGFQFFLD